MKLSAAIAVAVLAGCLLLLAITASASTQSCNTACQSQMTDCLLACDGRLPCEIECKKKAVGCVEICSSDAGPPVLAPADGGDATVAAPIEAAVGDAARARARADAGHSPSRDH